MDEEDDYNDEETKTYRDNRFEGEGGKKRHKHSVRAEAERLYDLHSPPPKLVDDRVKLFVTEFLFVSLVRRRVRHYKRKLKMKHQREVDVKPELEGSSCGCLEASNVWRKRTFDICTSDRFEDAIAVIIFLNCAALMIDYPAAPAYIRELAAVSDVFFCIVFNIEAVMRVVALGFYKSGETRSAYLEDGYNIIDFLVVIVTNVSMFLTAIGESIPLLRLVRALRPLRVIVRFVFECSRVHVREYNMREYKASLLKYYISHTHTHTRTPRYDSRKFGSSWTVYFTLCQVWDMSCCSVCWCGSAFALLAYSSLRVHFELATTLRLDSHRSEQIERTASPPGVDGSTNKLHISMTFLQHFCFSLPSQLVIPGMTMFGICAMQ